MWVISLQNSPQSMVWLHLLLLTYIPNFMKKTKKFPFSFYMYLEVYNILYVLLHTLYILTLVNEQLFSRQFTSDLLNNSGFPIIYKEYRFFRKALYYPTYIAGRNYFFKSYLYAPGWCKIKISYLFFQGCQ